MCGWEFDWVAVSIEKGVKGMKLVSVLSKFLHF